MVFFCEKEVFAKTFIVDVLFDWVRLVPVTFFYKNKLYKNNEVQTKKIGTKAERTETKLLIRRTLNL